MRRLFAPYRKPPLLSIRWSTYNDPRTLQYQTDALVSLGMHACFVYSANSGDGRAEVAVLFRGPVCGGVDLNLGLSDVSVGA